MTSLSGTRLGVYEIAGPIGAGGMGEVYRGRDTRLNREVALKVLPELFAQDAERLARFRREAQVLASLNHPNIAGIYGFEEAGHVHALVLELVEGPTLAERLAQGAMPLDEALDVARQIADALEAAHEQGIVHRDLKPANVKLRSDGAVKVLDFGLAKALEPPSSIGSDVTVSPTITSPAMTRAGLILGTAAYMSPEQARGRAADKRSDVWAFGAVLFEMLAGRRAFDPPTSSGSPDSSRSEGEDVADTLAFVLTKDPDWAQLPVDTPASVLKLLRRCLVKDRKRRLADLADARLEIDEALGSAEQAAGPLSAVSKHERPGAVTGGARKWAWAAAGAVTAGILVAAGFVAWSTMRTAPAPEAVRFVVLPPEGRQFTTAPRFLSLSPDGRMLAFVTGWVTSEHRLWIRPLDSLTAREIPGTESAISPTWSPDGQSIAFIAGIPGRLRRVDLGGGPPQTLADSVGPSIAWSPHGVILFTGRDGRIYRVPESGGDTTPISELLADEQETRHAPGFFLSDGRRFVFHARNTAGTKSVLYLSALDSPSRTRLLDVQSNIEYANGHLVYQREGTLMIQAFDDKEGRISGAAVPLVENVDYISNGQAAFSVSANGALAYRSGAGAGSSALTWFGRDGKVLSTLGPEGIYQGVRSPVLSPDGQRLALTRGEGQGKSDIWLIDLERNVPSRFTFDGTAQRPVWSPDGTRIVFSSNRKGARDLYRQDSRGGGTGPGEVVFESPHDKDPQAFSPDGKVLLFGQSPQGNPEIWALPMSGDRTPIPIVRTGFPAGNAVFSPDGRWFAYCEGDSGADQVYIQPYPPDGTRIRVSSVSGSSPQWSADGKTILYTTANGHLQAAAVRIEAGGLRVEVPEDLFLPPATFLHRAVLYDSPRSRVLLPVSRERGGPEPIIVVLNWIGEATSRRSGAIR